MRKNFLVSYVIGILAKEIVTSHGKTYTNGYPLKRGKRTAEKRVSNGPQKR